MCMGVLPAFMSMHLCASIHIDQKVASDSIELKLQVIVNHHVVDGSQILALWKTSQYF